MKLNWTAIPLYTASCLLTYVMIFVFLPTNDAIPLMLDVTTAESRRHVWTWWTYSLVHADAIHMGVNMAYLVVYGTAAEVLNSGTSAWNKCRVPAVHAISIIGGAFALCWQERTAENVTFLALGTSGGNYGLVFSCFGYVLLNWRALSSFTRLCMTIVTILTIISDIAISVTIAMVIDDNGDGKRIAFAIHIGGLLFGFLSSIAIYKKIKHVENTCNRRYSFELLDKSNDAEEDHRIHVKNSRFISGICTAFLSIFGTISMLIP